MVKRYLTTGEAAAELGIHAETLRRWVKDGLVKPTFRTARRGDMRWNLADLERQLDAGPNARHEPNLAAPQLPAIVQLQPADKPQQPAVVAAVITSRQGFLAVRRRDEKPIWSFPAGESEPGESPADTATRECKEETGLLINTGTVIYERLHPKTGRHMVYIAATAARGRDQQDVHVGDENELAEVRWLTLREAEDLMPDMATAVWQYLSQRLTGRARGSRKPPQLPYEATG